jgi:hypothetical protein
VTAISLQDLQCSVLAAVQYDDVLSLLSKHSTAVVSKLQQKIRASIDVVLGMSTVVELSVHLYTTRTSERVVVAPFLNSVHTDHYIALPIAPWIAKICAYDRLVDAHVLHR